jgi:hypothetical protein
MGNIAESEPIQASDSASIFSKRSIDNVFHTKNICSGSRLVDFEHFVSWQHLHFYITTFIV